MPAIIMIGGKSPAKQKRRPGPPLLGIEEKPTPPESPQEKGGGPVTPKPAPKSPAAAPPTVGKVKPGTAQFTSQDETCSTCEYFDEAGNGGVGECKKGVPEADYSTADPTASRCRFFEANDDATETPKEEAAEGEPEAEAVPA